MTCTSTVRLVTRQLAVGNRVTGAFIRSCWQEQGYGPEEAHNRFPIAQPPELHLARMVRVDAGNLFIGKQLCAVIRIVVRGHDSATQSVFSGVLGRKRLGFVN